MALLDLLSLSKSYESQQVLNEINFSIEKYERICILGKNGDGKSTLMKIINGTLDFEDGKRVVQNSIKIEMLHQTPTFKEGISVKKAIEDELSELKNAKIEYDKILLRLEEEYENKELIKQQEELTNFLDIHNAWSIEDKIQRVLQQFDLKEYENNPISMLSGGEKRRVTLAGLILKKPDILLLDEPTNHLDVYMVEFLEEMLLKEKFTLIFISHDRYFIDSIATKIIEIDNCTLRGFAGGYENYLNEKEFIIRSLTKSHSVLLKHLKSEEAWLKKGVKARLKRNEGRKQRVLELRQSAKKNPSLIQKMKLELQREQKNFNQEKSVNKQKMLFELNDISKQLGDKKLIKSFSSRILQNDRIAIVGKNGTGKSTLLRILLKDIKVDSGSLKKGEFNIGYFDQQRIMLDDNKNIIETFCPNGGDRVDVRGRDMHVFGYLKNFLFPKEYLNKKIGMLSGGEKNRVAIALLFTKNIDALILDEPTNDLDIPTINILEEYIENFQGAVIFVSHDRYFVDKIAQKLYIFNGDGKIEESYQTYSQYLSLEKELKILDTFTCIKSEVKKIVQTNRTLKLSYQEKKDYETLPQKIEKVEEKIMELKDSLNNPQCYQEMEFEQVAKMLKENEDALEPLIDSFFKAGREN